MAVLRGVHPLDFSKTSFENDNRSCCPSQAFAAGVSCGLRHLPGLGLQGGGGGGESRLGVGETREGGKRKEENTKLKS